MSIEERVRRLELWVVNRAAIREDLERWIRRGLAAKGEACEHGVRLGEKCRECFSTYDVGDMTARCICGCARGKHASDSAGRPCTSCPCRRFRPAEPRDEFQRAVERDAVVDALRAQVADLEREIEAHWVRRKTLAADVDAARAEKAEREFREYAAAVRDVIGALKDSPVGVGPCGASLADQVRKLTTTLAARDATIAEARGFVERYRGLQLPGSDAAVRCDAWLAGQPAGAAEPHPEPHSCEAAEQAIESLEADLLEARAEVARLDGLVKRAEPIMEDRMKWAASPGVQDTARQWLADLRAGRAS